MLPVIIGNACRILDTVFKYAIPVTVVAREASHSLTHFTHCNGKVRRTGVIGFKRSKDLTSFKVLQWVSMAEIVVLIQAGIIDLAGVVLCIPQQIEEVFRLTDQVDIVMATSFLNHQLSEVHQGRAIGILGVKVPDAFFPMLMKGMSQIWQPTATTF